MAETPWARGRGPLAFDSAILIQFQRLILTAVASFLVLFLEVALIRWMPAHIRLLSFFSNFILLGSFLGIGLGCLRANAKRRLFPWFPLILLGVVAAVYYL